MQRSIPPSRIQRYRLLSLIGHTKNSDVYVCLVPGTNQKIVMKLIQHNQSDVKRENGINRECKIHLQLSELGYPYIMPIVDTFDFQSFRVIMMPRAFGGSLGERKIRNQISIAKIMYRSLKALNFLHNRHILHGDIKPGNIVLDTSDENEPKPLFIDFGHAKELSQKQYCHCHNMTCSFSSPELLAFKPHSFPTDIWSMAATFFYMITGKELLRNKSLDAMVKDALSLKLNFNEKEWGMYPSSLKDLLCIMFHRIPEKRPTAYKCLHHSFFSDILDDEWIMNENTAVPIQSISDTIYY